jgi:putative cell wall-binding protein
VDGDDPVTTMHRAGGGWASDDVTFTLDATDASAGVAETRYRLGPGPEQVYAGEVVTVSEEGTTVVSYWSTDRTGNVEDVHRARIGIDRTPPVTTFDAPASHAGSLRVTLSASDALSGVARTSCSLDGGAWTDAAALDVDTNGMHTLRFRSADAAGNVEDTRTVTFTVAAHFDRIAGDDRYGTSVAASREAFPDGADAVVLCTGANWPDAISGSALAGAYSCPTLLTVTDEVPDPVLAEIRRLGARQVFLLGGTSAIGPSAVTQLRHALPGVAIVRLGGIDRYETAALVAAAVVEKLHEDGRAFDGVAFVASGRSFPDALAAAPVAAYRCRPILLSKDATLTSFTEAFVRDEVREAVVLGGPPSVATDIEVSLGGVLDGRVRRIAGADRYATSALVAEYGVSEGLAWDGVALATGALFPDALTGGVMKGRLGSVMLLTPPARLAPEAAAALAAHRDVVTRLRFLGGLDALPLSVRMEAMAALED